MSYYIVLVFLVIFVICLVASAYYLDKTGSMKAKVYLGVSFVCFCISIISLPISYQDVIENETIEAKDITIRVHYIDGSTQTFSFVNVRKWYPEVNHYKGDYHIRVEDRIIIGGYRYDLLKQTNKTIKIKEYYEARR